MASKIKKEANSGETKVGWETLKYLPYWKCF